MERLAAIATLVFACVSSASAHAQTNDSALGLGAPHPHLSAPTTATPTATAPPTVVQTPAPQYAVAPTPRRYGEAPMLPDGRMRLLVTSDQPGRVLHRLVTESSFHVSIRAPLSFASYSGNGYGASYAMLCVAPCATYLEPGAYAFAVSDRGGGMLSADEGIMQIDSPRAIHVTLDRHGTERALGWLIGVLGLLGTGAMIAWGIYKNDQPLWVSGGILAGLAFVGWAALTSLRDAAHIEIVG